MTQPSWGRISIVAGAAAAAAAGACAAPAGATRAHAGTQVVDRKDFVFRLRRDVAITHLAYSIFRGGHTPSWAADRTGTVDVDDLLVTSTG